VRRPETLRGEESRVNHESKAGQEYEPAKAGQVLYEMAQAPTKRLHCITHDTNERTEQDSTPEKREPEARVLVPLIRHFNPDTG